MTRFHLFVLLASCALPTIAYAQDARQTYSGLAGHNQTTKLITMVCGTDDSGTPILCGTSDTDARIRYEGLDGFVHSTTLVSNVCSVDSNGVPQLCDTSSGGSSDSALNIVDNLVTASGTWPSSDPLVAGQAWSDGGVMMLSTGSAAKPTFDGSGLANVATLNSSGQVTAPIATTAASSTGALTVTSSGASITGNVSGTTKKWTLGRRPQDTYMSLQSYNGSSWQHLTINDDGSVDTGLGYLANLGADAAFSGLVSAKTLKSTGDAEFSGNISLDNGKAMTFHGSSGTTAASSYMYGDSSGNIVVSGSMAVPDTGASDSSKSPLNTESASSRFLSKSDAANYVSASALSAYLPTSAASRMYAPINSPALTGTPTSTTPATTDNSTSIATTAFVNNAFQSVEYSTQGDISTAGSSIQVPFGTSGLYAKFAYTGSGSASMTFCSSSGTLSPVDIRRNSIWGGSGVETYTLDNGSVDTSCVTADSTVYTQSQDSSAYFIRVGGQVYFLTVWASNNGARAFMGVHKMI